MSDRYSTEIINWKDDNNFVNVVSKILDGLILQVFVQGREFQTTTEDDNFEIGVHYVVL